MRPPRLTREEQGGSLLYVSPNNDGKPTYHHAGMQAASPAPDPSASRPDHWGVCRGVLLPYRPSSTSTGNRWEGPQRRARKKMMARSGWGGLGESPKPYPRRKPCPRSPWLRSLPRTAGAVTPYFGVLAVEKGCLSIATVWHQGLSSQSGGGLGLAP